MSVPREAPDQWGRAATGHHRPPQASPPSGYKPQPHGRVRGRLWAPVQWHPLPESVCAPKPCGTRPTRLQTALWGQAHTAGLVCDTEGTSASIWSSRARPGALDIQDRDPSIRPGNAAPGPPRWQAQRTWVSSEQAPRTRAQQERGPERNGAQAWERPEQRTLNCTHVNLPRKRGAVTQPKPPLWGGQSTRARRGTSQRDH